MTGWSICELMHLTREELCALVSNLEHELQFLEAGTVSRLRILVSLENIRRVMILRGFQA